MRREGKKDSNRRTLFLMCGLCLLLGTGSLWIWKKAATPKVIWGGQPLTVSERDHFFARLGEVIHLWQTSSPKGFETPKEPSLLGIDLERGHIWLEQDGQPVPEAWVALPKGVDWQLYHCHSSGATETLPRFTVLRSLPDAFKPSHHERIHLVGQSNDYGLIYWLLSSVWDNSSFGEHHHFGPSNLPRLPPEARHASSEKPSVVVDDPILLSGMQVRSAQFPEGQNTATDFAVLPPSFKQYQEWRASQGQLFQAVEQYLVNKGYSLRWMRAKAGPSYTNGSIGVMLETANRPSRWHDILRRLGIWQPFSNMAFFEIENHEGTWQCFRTEPVRASPLFSVPVPKTHTGGPDSAYTGPPSAFPAPYIGQTPWSYTAQNGVTIQIVGICLDNGHLWWSPDGTPSPFWPGYFSRELGSGSPFESVNDDLIEMAYSHHYDIPRGERLLVIRTNASRLVNSTFDMRLSFRQWQRDGPVDCLDPLTDQNGNRVHPGRYIVARLHPDKTDRTTDCIVRLVLHPGLMYSPGDPNQKQVNPSATNNDIPITMHLKDISLHMGQRTDFKMEVIAGDVDGSQSSQITVYP
jgi:hypothetical protein